MNQFAFFADVIEADFADALSSGKRRMAMVRALNKIARDARAEAARRILNEVNLPAKFVGPAQGRLSVTKQATRGSLEARITARGRATSLAQFIHGTPKTGSAGVWVEIAPGKARFLKKAFLIKLPQGSNPVTDTKFNLGLAVRLKPGDSLKNKLTARRVASGLYVLYGPSVSQVFRANDDSGVANEMAPSVAQKLSDEFMRLLEI